MKNRCVTCHKIIAFRFSLCHKCGLLYGQDSGDWPPWLAFLVRENERMRKRHERNPNRETPFSDNPDIENIPYIDDKDKDRF